MQRRTFLKQSATTSLVALITPTGIVRASQATAPADDLATAFAKPPMSARAHTWWHWMNGNVTKDGITRDLEAMQTIGLGGFQNFDAGTGIPKGPLVYLSPDWLELKKHTIREAQRLGLEFTMHNCPGWSSSGGPWITPDRSMQQVVWSETGLTGGQSVSMPLPQPITRLNYYQDIRVLAFPALPGEEPLPTLVEKITVGTTAVVVDQLANGLAMQPGEGGTGSVLITFKQPYDARSLSFISQPIAGVPAPAPAAGGSMTFGRGGTPFTLEGSADGTTFQSIANGSFSTAPEPEPQLLEFAPARYRHFRLTSATARQLTQLSFSATPRLPDWRKKTNDRFNNIPPPPADAVPATNAIRPDQLIDLTDRMDKQGNLRWDAPAGNWTILRIGFTPIGTLNRSAPDTGIGLECDKYSPDAITFHLDKMMEQLLPTLGPLAKSGKVGLLIDSYEVGMQNWTARFPDEFRRRAGYDLTNYLPTLTGRVIDSTDTTERFLWDFRRAQADLMADAYYGQFRQFCQQHDILAYAEPYDRGPMEEMQIGSRVGANMGEFWNGLSTLFQNNWTMRRTTKLAASIAHTNGQAIVGAESYTGEPESARWQEYPFGMKALGDKMFAQGLNRIIFHRYAHQPHPTARPGMTMGPWGIHLDRTNTWWPVGRAWLDYIARCQYLLQQGLFVADLAYFTGEDPGIYTRVSPDELTPAPPDGYDYDLINGETLLTKATVKNNRLTLPDGMSYRILVLQNPDAMTLPMLRKLRELIRQGLCIVGNPPRRTPGLNRNPADETEFAAIRTELWGAEPQNDRTVGSGRVVRTMPLDTLLTQLNTRPDVQISSRSGDAPITWIHRRVGDTDLYFLANQRRTAEDLVCTFRVGNRQPEHWNPLNGNRGPLPVFDTDGTTTRVALRLDPAGSAFVAFRQPAGPAIRSVQRNGQVLLSATPFPAKTRTLFPQVVNNFTISLWAKPELNVMLGTRNFMDHIADPWTDYYAIYPPPGRALYGDGHETAGLTIGRNGVAVWQHGAGNPVLTLAAPAALSGWSHVALVYRDGIPSVFVNGKLIQAGKEAGKAVHPGVGQAYLREGASFYNGDMTPPVLTPSALTDAQISQLAAQPRPTPPTDPVVLLDSHPRPLLLFRQPGNYTAVGGAGKAVTIRVGNLAQPLSLSGPWTVAFPANLGAPKQITLPKLTSLHLHSDAGVRHFSGTATYQHTVSIPANADSARQRYLLDLGQCEVIAEVVVNGTELGTLWSRPYRIDITDALKPGQNELLIRVTNLWPNRLIGDEYLPDEARYTPGAGGSGFASLSGGAIEALPDWYKEGKPKPPAVAWRLRPGNTTPKTPRCSNRA
ncbi:glycosyl hydrolase [Spirosoma rhododendri]|uniref:Glycosyl hydrolase family 43 n=1 Tax=Spirosoma rhododendri TaxID=2728024 RepID=A0A7L5DSP4_9BACT|nr:glycosyl hydrolase [Spirosoma rhododendri]QJD79598.1 glycosyl hydrolase family 43 [Spirosoma rhododendri]